MLIYIITKLTMMRKKIQRTDIGNKEDVINPLASIKAIMW